jgi:hypothetical protein
MMIIASSTPSACLFIQRADHSLGDPASHSTELEAHNEQDGIAMATINIFRSQIDLET